MLWDAPESFDDPRNVIQLPDGRTIHVVAFDGADSGGDSGGPAVTATALTREQASPAMLALDKLGALMDNPAFTDPGHPDHKTVTAEVRRLRGLLG